MQKYGPATEFDAQLKRDDNGPFYKVADVDAEIKALKARIKMQSGLIEKGKKKYRKLLAERKVVRGADVRVGVEQPDGEIKWFDGSVSGELVKVEPAPGTQSYTMPTSVATAYRCELGENCRCNKGDELGCWNWVTYAN